jgi:hypothetical protein
VQDRRVARDSAGQPDNSDGAPRRLTFSKAANEGRIDCLLPRQQSTDCHINSTKTMATHHLTVASVPSTIDIYRRPPRAHRYIDFVDLASPNFPERAAILRDKNAMRASLGRAKSGVVAAIKSVEMNGDELFAGGAL